jgi:hypothetical protein
MARPRAEEGGALWIERKRLLLLHRRLRAMCPGLRMKGLRRISKRAAGIGEERVPIAITATTGGHTLTLGQGIEAAGHNGGSHVLAAILTRRSRRRHRDEGPRAQRRDRRNPGFQKLFHVRLSLYSFIGFSPVRRTWDAREPRAIADEK